MAYAFCSAAMAPPAAAAALPRRYCGCGANRAGPRDPTRPALRCRPAGRWHGSQCASANREALRCRAGSCWQMLHCDSAGSSTRRSQACSRAPSGAGEPHERLQRAAGPLAAAGGSRRPAGRHGWPAGAGNACCASIAAGGGPAARGWSPAGPAAMRRRSAGTRLYSRNATAAGPALERTTPAVRCRLAVSATAAAAAAAAAALPSCCLAAPAGALIASEAAAKQSTAWFAIHYHE